MWLVLVFFLPDGKIMGNNVPLAMLMLALRKRSIKALKSVVEGNDAEVLHLILKTMPDRIQSCTLILQVSMGPLYTKIKMLYAAFRSRGNNMALLRSYMLTEEVGTMALRACCVWVGAQCRINFGLIVLAGICQQSLPSCLYYAVAVNPSLL